MTRTPDRFPGSREDDELILEDVSQNPLVEGAMRYVLGSFQFKDGSGVFNARVGGGADLGQLVLTLAGGVVYDGSGEVVIKQSA